MFWVFHVLRDYAASLREDDSRFVPQLGALLAHADELGDRPDRRRLRPQ